MHNTRFTVSNAIAATRHRKSGFVLPRSPQPQHVKFPRLTSPSQHLTWDQIYPCLTAFGMDSVNTTLRQHSSRGDVHRLILRQGHWWPKGGFILSLFWDVYVNIAWGNWRSGLWWSGLLPWPSLWFTGPRTTIIYCPPTSQGIGQRIMSSVFLTPANHSP